MLDLAVYSRQAESVIGLDAHASGVRNGTNDVSLRLQALRWPLEAQPCISFLVIFRDIKKLQSLVIIKLDKILIEVEFLQIK